MPGRGGRQRLGREAGTAQAGMQALMPGSGAGSARGGKEALPRRGCRGCPGRDAGSAQAGEEAEPGKGGRECPDRVAGSQEGHRLLPGLWGGADGKKTLPCPRCSVPGATPSPSPAPSSISPLMPTPWEPPEARPLWGRRVGPLPGSLSLL